MAPTTSKRTFSRTTSNFAEAGDLFSFLREEDGSLGVLAKHARNMVILLLVLCCHCRSQGRIKKDDVSWMQLRPFR